MTDNNGKVRPFGIKDKLGYMFGDFGNDFTFLLSAMFLLKFYTDVMGVSAALVGLMMMAARFVDAITDVTMGQIVDRSRPGKKGKFAPWLRRMCGPVALASFLMYATWFKDMPMGFKIFWMFFTYLLWGSICYTGINIPYGSMASAISDNPTDRTSLSNWSYTCSDSDRCCITTCSILYRRSRKFSIIRSENDAWCFGMFNRSSNLLYALLQNDNGKS